MICIGIESTAHTLGIGVCEDGKILANEKRMHVPPKGQGIVPRAAADEHAANFMPVLRQALLSAKIKAQDADLFAFSQGPGIGQCLRVGCAGAKYLSLRFGKPIVGVNHCAAHLEVSRGVLGMEDPLFIYVSGANTQIIIKSAEKGKGAKRYRVLGETLDIGLGNLFDVFARNAQIVPQHGSEVARLAEMGEYFPLPYTVKGMNFAFAGLLTAGTKLIGKKRLEDICCSLVETSFAEICEATERALCLTAKKELVVCGGVAQNKRFCEMLSLVAEEHGARFGVAPPQLNADNGAMIAYTALLEKPVRGISNIRKIEPKGYWRIDEVI